ncbi:hypothetical protein [Rossellomorea vietnamensis]|uniref:hypothetical protein n=1 Tax=Rossellomorea vietnamensis TaxID=218284 RepID=UPI001E494639|nr:hypothetical protein [Rossellomorea vietnamensis]MCC5800925.1 hypothetical protein [Rossellomorea vietnamensis]
MKIIILPLMTFSLMLVGCNNSPSIKQKEDVESSQSESVQSENTYKEKQKELIQFINEDIKEIVMYEGKANQALESVSGENYQNDEQLYEVLTSTVIPTYKNALEKAKSLDTNMKELKPMKAKMEEAASIYYEALILEKKGFKKRQRTY